MLTAKEHEMKKTRCPKRKSQDLEHVIERFLAKTASQTGGWWGCARPGFRCISLLMVDDAKWFVEQPPAAEF